MHLRKPATTRVAKTLHQASAVRTTLTVDERHLADSLGLSYHTVRLAIAALHDAGAIQVSRAHSGDRQVTVLSGADYWTSAGVLGGAQ